MKNRLIGKDLMLGKIGGGRRRRRLEVGGEDWRREEKGTTKDEMAGWHHQLDGHEFE